MNSDFIEQLAASVHDQWMKSKRDIGITSRLAENGEELMVPYEQLSETQKDLDRNSVKAVLKSVYSLGFTVVMMPHERPRM